MKKEVIKEILKKQGWKEDGYGNLKKKEVTSKGEVVQMRYKFTKLALRCEVKSPATGRWINLLSGYYKNVYLSKEGKLRIKQANSGLFKNHHKGSA